MVVYSMVNGLLLFNAADTKKHFTRLANANCSTLLPTAAPHIGKLHCCCFFFIKCLCSWNMVTYLLPLLNRSFVICYFRNLIVNRDDSKGYWQIWVLFKGLSLPILQLQQRSKVKERLTFERKVEKFFGHNSWQNWHRKLQLVSFCNCQY